MFGGGGHFRRLRFRLRFRSYFMGGSLRQEAISERGLQVTNQCIQYAWLWLRSGRSFFLGRCDVGNRNFFDGFCIRGWSLRRTSLNFIPQSRQQRWLRLQSLQLAISCTGLLVHPIRKVEADLFNCFFDRFWISRNLVFGWCTDINSLLWRSCGCYGFI